MLCHPGMQRTHNLLACSLCQHQNWPCVKVSDSQFETQNQAITMICSTIELISTFTHGTISCYFHHLNNWHTHSQHKPRIVPIDLCFQSVFSCKLNTVLNCRLLSNWQLYHLINCIFLFQGSVNAFLLDQTELSVQEFLPTKPNHQTKQLFGSGFGAQFATAQTPAATNPNNLGLFETNFVS